METDDCRPFPGVPAIFPASATIIEKHEREKKQRKGLHGEQRGIEAAADDALGAALGSVGLLVFAAICWVFFPRYSPPLVLPSATLAWMAAASLVWIVRKRGWRRLFHSTAELGKLLSPHR